MIEILRTIDLKSEVKSLIVAKKNDDLKFKELDDLLKGGLSLVDKKSVVWTLSLINSPKVHLYLNEKRDLEEIAKLEGDFVVLVDSFAKEKDAKQVAYELALNISSLDDELTLKTDAKEKNRNFYFYSKEDIKEAVNEGIIVGQSVSLTKRLVNLPPNYLSAPKFAEIALEKLKGLRNVSIRILGKKEIEELNMGAFLAVNKGSYEEPKLIEIKYQGLEHDDDYMCFVGKGLVFDTGGYSLKTRMNNMKSDMAGGASVLGAALATANLNLKVNALFLIGATDNRLGEYAIVPDDVITSMSGKTIEITSSDAEGRLVLVDVITYAQKLGAKKIIDIATLTGAIIQALGSHYTGAYTNDDKFYEGFKEVTNKTKEKIWLMPLDECYFDNIKSKIADMKNSGGRSGTASSAALFISKFIEPETKWIHLDIAGTSFIDECATAVMVKTFVEYLRSIE